MTVNINHARYSTQGGVVVVRQSQACDGNAELLRRTMLLDTQPGALYSCGVNYPGRYRRKDLVFVNPPIRITACASRIGIESLNARGRILMPEFVRALDGMSGLLTIIESGESGFACAVGNDAHAEPATEEQRTRTPGVMTVIRALLAHFECDDDDSPGLYGAFGYDLAFQFEQIEQKLHRDSQQRDLVLYLPDEILTVDPETGAGTLVRYDFVCRDALNQIQTTGGLKREVRTSSPEPVNSPEPENTPFRSDHADGEYAAIVQQARNHFARGDLFEVVPGQTFSGACSEPASSIYVRLKQTNPAPYAALMNLGNGEHLISASPEMYVRVHQRRVETCPISGTIRRGANALEDADRIRELLNSEKDEAELSMCTDVDRNDKSRVCVPGSVKVIGRRQIELYSRLIHTVDHVEGKLLPGFDALDAFLSHTWAVTVTGAPKQSAMQFIENHEKSPRQWYGGAFGKLGFDGSMDTGLTLRTIHLLDGVARVRVGATLLHDSDPVAEEAETRLKASALLDVLRPRPQAMASNAAPVDLRRLPSGHLKALMVDHRDSFVHTLAAAFRAHGVSLETMRPVSARQALQSRDFDLVIMSPGPGRPQDHDCAATLALCEQRGIPVFGVCLGLQAMVEYFGGSLGTLATPVHGKASLVDHRGDGLFKGIRSGFRAGRYHSLFAATLPACLKVTSTTAAGAGPEVGSTVMSVAHRTLPWAAVQFHPESIMSQDIGDNGRAAGDSLIANVVQSAREASVAEMQWCNARAACVK
tara:strand:- start:16791 stop:19073 length:2283 start_codon:yes stop_codon:yes gene_type:complete